MIIEGGTLMIPNQLNITSLLEPCYVVSYSSLTNTNQPSNLLWAQLLSLCTTTLCAIV